MSALPVFNGDESQLQSSLPLFQFWDKDIPDAVAELVEGVASTNASLNYQFFDDVSAAEYILKYFGADTHKLYQSCIIPAMRADLFRYCFLVQHGGLYVDADFGPISSLEPILEKPWKGCLFDRDSGLNNSFMYFASANHPLAEKILEIALSQMINRISKNVWVVTGPFILQKLHEKEGESSLFEGIHLMNETEFANYLKLGPNLAYKQDDSHWLVARKKGLEIFKD